MRNSNIMHFFRISRGKKDYSPNKEKQSTTLFSLFQSRRPLEKLLTIIGIIFSMLSMISLPFYIIIIADMLELFIERTSPHIAFHEPYLIQYFGGGIPLVNGTAEEYSAYLREDSNATLLALCIMGLAEFVFQFMFVICLEYAAELQTSRLRRSYFKALISKDMSWHDLNVDSNLTVSLNEDLNNIYEGGGDKLGFFINKVAQFAGNLIICFIVGWKLTLALIFGVPLIAFSQALITKVQSSMVAKEQKSYAEASNIAEDVFSSIKTVFAFGGQQKEKERYEKYLAPSLKYGILRGLFGGIGYGLFTAIYNVLNSIISWYGAVLIQDSRDFGDDDYTPSVLRIIMVGVISGALNFGTAFPLYEAFTVAKSSAGTVFKVINTPSTIDPFSSAGKVLPEIFGDVELKGVHFSYPARPAVKVLKGLDLKIKSGSKVAIVGNSGSGKSTVISLIQRFYDPSKGSILIDGVDIRDLNISCLRQCIGVVSQEPQLFGTTIYENILYGETSATKEEVERAAKIANAHHFIMELPQGYETSVGQRGTQLSGGQKQRIAIARAIIRNPKILLLDEATSALDSSNEAVVQQALDRAAVERTTIIVAHRLSTVKNADLIIVVSDGQFIESGTHRELFKKNGEYRRLLNMQRVKLSESEDGTIDQFKNTVSYKNTFNLERAYETKDKIECDVKDKKEAPKDKKKSSLKRIFALTKPELLQFIGAIVCLIIGSLSAPVTSIIFGIFFGSLGGGDRDQLLSSAKLCAWLYVLLGLVVGLTTFLQTYCLAFVGSRLTWRIRKNVFASIVNQEPAWFDQEENKVGALSAKLSSSARNVQSITGSALSLTLQSLTTLIAGLTISFIYSWKMASVSLALYPFMLSSFYLRFSSVRSSGTKDNSAMEKATMMAVEALSAIRTVAGLTREQAFIDRYDKELLESEGTIMKKSLVRAGSAALGQTLLYVSIGAATCYGGHLIADHDATVKDILTVNNILLYCTWLLSSSLSSAPNILAAAASAEEVFTILDRKSALQDGTHELDEHWRPSGRVNYSKVEFTYPSRPDSQILQGLSLNIAPGTSIAIAGASGCGKSTLVQLLLRFYDPSSGKIELEEKNIANLPTSRLRQQMSLVSQEPILFDATIAENIAYGDNSREIPIDEIIQAAKMSNIHNFITSLPKGYETSLGKGGCQLSGGQKQRIAIARALVRNPQILLLDEATSALDAASESVVQAALNDASEGRTTITIGHRTGALTHADKICVLENGMIAEEGSHDELLARNGVYARINR